MGRLLNLGAGLYPVLRVHKSRRNLYDWRSLGLSAPPQHGWKRFLLIRRSISDPSEMTGYIVFARAHTTLSELVLIAGTRWMVEESIQTAKGEVGLDHSEVRSFMGWYRHMTLAMWASAFLSVIREESGAEVAPKKAAETEGAKQFGSLQGQPQSPVRLSCDKIRRLFWHLVLLVERSAATILHWSGGGAGIKPGRASVTIAGDWMVCSHARRQQRARKWCQAHRVRAERETGWRRCGNA